MRLTPERAAQEEREAQRYARYLRDGEPPEGWRSYNLDIIYRWSQTALLRVKHRARAIALATKEAER